MPPNCLLVDLLRVSIDTNGIYNGIFAQRISGCRSLGYGQAQPEQALEQLGLVVVGMEEEGM